jgi:hypothetical protein
VSRRLEPTVFSAMISPITLGLVIGAAALVVVSGGSWPAAVAAGFVVWFARVGLAMMIARRVSGLDPRIDPFALREPWRFFVRDALTARKRFAEAITEAEAGPLRERLREIEAQMTEAVTVTWDVARKGQQLTDARRRIDLPALQRVLDSATPDDPRYAAAVAQREVHIRLTAREETARTRLEILDLRLSETIVRASELSTRTGETSRLDALAEQVNGMVGELDSIRVALDEIDSDS